MALLVASCATDPFQLDQRQLAEGQATAHAFAWLVEQQRPDGFWGTDENRVALTSLATLAYFSHGETFTSEQYGKTVENAVRALAQEANRHAGRSQTEQALLTWCLAEVYGMTRLPALSSLLPMLVADLDLSSPTPWHPMAAYAVFISGAETDWSKQALLELEPKYAIQSNNLKDQMIHLFLTERLEHHHVSPAVMVHLRKQLMKSWRREEMPLQTAYLSYLTFFPALDENCRTWKKEFFPDLIRRQIVRGKLGWWTPECLGVGGTRETATMSANEGQIYATSLMLMTLARPSRIPIFYHCPGEEAPQEPGESQNIKIEIL